MSGIRDSIIALRDHIGIRLRKKTILTDPVARRLHDTCLAVDAKQTRMIPIAESRFVALDLETTGFYPSLGDEIVSVALLELHGLVFSGKYYSTIVNPGRHIPSSSSEIHGIFDADIRNAPTMDDVLPEVIAFLGNAVVIAHHANFDFRFLNKRLYRKAAAVIENPWIDTMLLYGAWQRKHAQYSLDDVAKRCGIADQGRHNALRDAEIAGGVLQFLVPRLLPDLGQSVGRLIECQFGDHCQDAHSQLM
uniref:DNA-directed DNA polymerase n=1 Tax=Candidatus Kentrum sp. TUN TaxID=2126343 RepID=A0A451A9Z8_9GAMM|nr:MAG: exonuclease, DNA polymerase III, epsilon subunit family [Candidatus Kentron sp. TUN]VFK61855.1 MAG: exonuclease, DNA polymerase III, epsilon subunit family [Candidatus Kentron sp. TUN]VFK62857.1 MAG: exonuclease, DNA polymerase III, epsilon subunit family [Candidatus Kentron sp. TUN]